MSTPDPWRVGPISDEEAQITSVAWEARQRAIDRGLHVCGWTVFDAYEAHGERWPKWVQYVYFSFPASLEVDAVRVLAEGPPETRDAVEAAYALGGWQAVQDMVQPLVDSGVALGDTDAGVNLAVLNHTYNPFPPDAVEAAEVALRLGASSLDVLEAVKPYLDEPKDGAPEDEDG